MGCLKRAFHRLRNLRNMLMIMQAFKLFYLTKQYEFGHLVFSISRPLAICPYTLHVFYRLTIQYSRLDTRELDPQGGTR